MSIAEKLQVIAANEQRVYDAGYIAGQFSGSYGDGYIAGQEAFWHLYQDHGNRTNYQRAFANLGWTNTTFKPLYNITATNMGQAFQGTAITNLIQLLADNNVILTTDGCTSFLQCFQSSTVTHIPALNLSASTNCSYAFSSNSIIEIGELVVASTTPFSYAFHYSTSLEKVSFSGEIGYNGIDFTYNKKLTHDSLMSIINCLQDLRETGETKSIALGATNLAKLTDAEKAIATEKGWSLS